MSDSSKRGVSITGYFSFSFLKIFPGRNFRKIILKEETNIMSNDLTLEKENNNEPNNQN